MSWPTLVQLHNSEYSHAYDGAEIRETWYIEPWDSVTAFIAAMLGRVDDAGGAAGPFGNYPIRTLPAVHFLYNWCFATACEVVPYDPRQFSYMGSANLSAAQAFLTLPQQLGRVTAATGTYSATNLFPTTNISVDGLSQANKTFSAGAFVVVTYLPLLTIVSGTGGTSLTSPSFDCVNYRLVPRLRTNVINSGLKLITPPMAVNLNGKWNVLYPDAGIAPVLKEEYQELVIDRRMLLPTFNLSVLSQYCNAVNGAFETLQINGVSSPLSFQQGTLRFNSYQATYVQVPQVDVTGAPNGYNRWLNLELHYDWRTTQSTCVRDATGALGAGSYPVSWNHVLAYPGLLSWINSLVGAQTVGLGWYRAKYSASSLGVDSDPYPTAAVATGNGGADILDPVTK